jgi:carbon starvation protein CstA
VANTVAFIGYTALLTTGAIAVIATIGASVVASPLLAAVGTVGMMSVAVVGLLAFVAILGSMLCVGDENKDKKVNDPSLGNDVRNSLNNG